MHIWPKSCCKVADGGMAWDGSLRARYGSKKQGPTTGTSYARELSPPGKHGNRPVAGSQQFQVIVCYLTAEL
jgi:hypothetical protein